MSPRLVSVETVSPGARIKIGEVAYIVESVEIGDHFVELNLQINKTVYPDGDAYITLPKHMPINIYE